MMTRRVVLLTLLIVAITTIACGDESRADQPPRIEYGRDVCSRCNMIISEERYAGGIVNMDGDALIFDDIGEMIFVIQDEGLQERRVWVHDAESLEWIDGTTAFYSASKEVVTPMGTGVTAFTSRAEAESFSAENAGTVMTWEEILADWKWEMERRMH